MAKSRRMTLPEIFRALANGKIMQFQSTDGKWYESDIDYCIHKFAFDPFDPSRWRLKPVPVPVPPGDLTQDEAQALFEKGERVQVLYKDGVWDDVYSPEGPMLWPEGLRSFRRKPAPVTPTIVPVPTAPKMVPLEAKDVRPGDVVRNGGWSDSWSSVVGAWAIDVGIASINAPPDGGHIIIRSYRELQSENWEISHDAGATWQRAEKPESA